MKEKTKGKGGAKGGNKKSVDAAPAPMATSSPTAETPSTPAMEPVVGKDTKMNLQLKSLDKRERNAIYTGAAVSLRIPVAAFPDKQAPATLEVSGLAEKRARLTPEERREARKNAPKPTLAQRVEAAEKRAAALREKLAKASEAAPATV